MGSDCVLSGLCNLGQRIRSKHSNIFFLSEIIEKLMQNNLTNETLLTSKYLTLSLENKGSLAAVESLFSVLRKMIVLSRQTWKEHEYFALLILLGTNNLFSKWCLFNVVFVLCCETGTEVDVILRILQTRKRNKAILTVVIGLKNILR